MKRLLMGVVGLGVLAAAGAWAQGGGMGGGYGRAPAGEPYDRFDEGSADTQEDRGPAAMHDREAFVDARVAALRAGLRLTPDQEALWPPVADALRGLARQRMEAGLARRERAMTLRGEDEQDLPSAIRAVADWQAASAEALRRVADASAPLYAALDDGQKHRLSMLGRLVGQRAMPAGYEDRRGMGGRYPMDERWDERRGPLGR